MTICPDCQEPLGVRNTIELPYHYCELDKLGDAWMVRYYPSPDLVLRLVIRHYSDEFPVEFVCEIKLRGSNAYVELARFWYDDVLPFRNDIPEQPDLTVFPEPWREAFAAMARHWVDLLGQTQFASSQGDPRHDKWPEPYAFE